MCVWWGIALEMGWKQGDDQRRQDHPMPGRAGVRACSTPLPIRSLHLLLPLRMPHGPPAVGKSTAQQVGGFPALLQHYDGVEPPHTSGDEEEVEMHPERAGPP